jgi:hypothetical protein
MALKAADQKSESFAKDVLSEFKRPNHYPITTYYRFYQPRSAFVFLLKKDNGIRSAKTNSQTRCDKKGVRLKNTADTQKKMDTKPTRPRRGRAGSRHWNCKRSRG